jgi:4,5-DOPA dioxygenase extradiol
VRAQRLYGSKSGKQEKGVLGCSEILPVIFVGLVNPMNTVLENGYTEAWRLIGKQTPRPKAILSIPRPLVCARNRRHRQYGAKNHSRFRRFSSRALPGAIILRPAVRISLAACNKCWRPYRSLLTTHGDSITGQGLCHVYPDADIPVAQLSIDET